jgi:hypothetical protein
MDKYIIIKRGKNAGRIKALRDFADVKTGDIGGYVESYENLSQTGMCWIHGQARVYGNAQVYNDDYTFDVLK